MWKFTSPDGCHQSTEFYLRSLLEVSPAEPHGVWKDLLLQMDVTRDEFIPYYFPWTSFSDVGHIRFSYLNFVIHLLA